MKEVNQSKILLCALFVSLLAFTACQKDLNVESNPSASPSKKPNFSTEIDAKNLTTVADEGQERVSSLLNVRAIVGDIEDEPVVIAGVDNDCTVGTPLERLQCLNNRAKMRVQVGKRQGISDILNITSINSTNTTNCYQYGGQNVCGYTGREITHPLNVPVNGNYRIQLTPKNPNRDFDVFVYRYAIVNGVFTKTLVGFGVFPQGKTETITITQQGEYDIVVDEYPNSSGVVGSGDGSYILAISSNTTVKTTASYNQNTNNVSYQFGITANSAPIGYRLESWYFKRKNGAVWQNAGTYPATQSFTFSCGTCDYAVAPIYINAIGDVRILGIESETLIRP
jgi:hypothetical protein